MRFPDNASSHRKQRCCACAVCGNELTRNLIGRHKKFCSDHCRVEAHRTKHVGRLPNRNVLQRLKNGARYPHSGLQRNDAKSACSTGTFLADFAGRGSGIHGPRHVIEAEIGGRNWVEVFSADGVRSYVTQIRPAALIEARRGVAQP